MDPNDKPLSYGVRQAIRDSSKTTYEIGRLSGVSPQNLYRFLAKDRPRALSQKSLDALGLLLKLKLTYHSSGTLNPGPGKHYKTTFGPDGRPVDVHDQINGPGDVPLSTQLGRAVKLHRKDVSEIAEHLGITKTQLYRFLDGSRGLSQDRLDMLCGVLKLVVEGPPVMVPPRVRGAMISVERRIYRPRSHAKPVGAAKEGGQQPSAPPKPPSLFLPPEDSPYGDN